MVARTAAANMTSMALLFVFLFMLIMQMRWAERGMELCTLMHHFKPIKMMDISSAKRTEVMQTQNPPGNAYIVIERVRPFYVRSFHVHSRAFRLMWYKSVDAVGIENL